LQIRRSIVGLITIDVMYLVAWWYGSDERECDKSMDADVSRLAEAIDGNLHVALTATCLWDDLVVTVASYSSER